MATAHNLARYAHVAKLLTDYMAQNNLRPGELGRLIDPHSKNPASVVSAWTHAKGAPGPKLRPKVAKLLGVAEEALLPRNTTSPANGQHPATGAEPKPVKQAFKPNPFSFVVSPDGRARITLDIDLPIERAMRVLATLTNINGLIEGKLDEITHAEGDNSE